MTRGSARGGMPQAIAHVAQLADCPVQLLRLLREHLPIDADTSVWRERAGDLIQREASRAPDCDQPQPFQHAGIKHTMQAPPAN